MRLSGLHRGLNLFIADMTVRAGQSTKGNGDKAETG